MAIESDYPIQEVEEFVDSVYQSPSIGHLRSTGERNNALPDSRSLVVRKLPWWADRGCLTVWRGPDIRILKSVRAYIDRIRRVPLFLMILEASLSQNIKCSGCHLCRLFDMP